MLIYNFYGLLLSSHVQKKVLAFCFYTLLSWNGNNMLLSIVVRAKWMLLLLCVGWCPLGEENAAGIGRPTHLLSFFLPDAYTYSHKKWEPTQNCYFVQCTYYMLELERRDSESKKKQTYNFDTVPKELFSCIAILQIALCIPISKYP